MIRKEDIVKIGQFAKPHGIKGEISLITSFDLFDDEEESPFVICEIEGIYVPFFVEEFRYKSDNVVLLKLENLNSDEEVKAFTNTDVYCPKDWLDNEGTDSGITWDNFIGYKVYDIERGYLGEVEAVDDSTINVLFQISYEGNDLLLPVAEELISSLEHDKKTMVLSVPQGLFEL